MTHIMAFSSQKNSRIVEAVFDQRINKFTLFALIATKSATIVFEKMVHTIK